MPGLVTQLTPLQAKGFALHPQRTEYGVLVHVVHQRTILSSAIADLPPPSNRDRQTNCWFHLPLETFGFSYLELKALSFVIGETEELLDVSRVTRRPKSGQVTPLTVEDLILANARRPWISGSTYLDAEEAGVSDADIVELLYMDILGRRPDPDGLANYLFHRREGTKSLGDVRRELLESNEYAVRRKDAAWAPGAIFSQPIALRSSTVGMEADVARSPRGVSALPKRPAQARVDDLPRVVTRFRKPRIPAPTTRQAEPAEIKLKADSALLGLGWYDTEYLEDVPFRWMASVGVIFNPQPRLACTGISLQVAHVYGAHAPMLDCYLDEVPADVRVEESGKGFLILIMPLDRNSISYTQLRIESRVSGCPATENRGVDTRELSLNLLSAVIAYEPASTIATEGAS